MHISSILSAFHSKYEPKYDPDIETRKTDKTDCCLLEAFIHTYTEILWTSEWHLEYVNKYLFT